MSSDYDVSNIQVIPTPRSLYEMIRQIRERPGMYLSDPTLSALYNYVNGFQVGYALAGIDESETPPFREFNEFVRTRTGFYESTGGWRHMLLSYHKGDELKSFEDFFNMFEAFLKFEAR